MTATYLRPAHRFKCPWTQEEAIDALAVLVPGAIPLEPFAGYNSPWRLSLPCGHVGSARLNHLLEGQGPCFECGHSTSADAQKLPEAEALASLTSAGMVPLVSWSDVVAAAKAAGRTPATQPWPSRCLACGAEVTPCINSIRKGRGGCRPCGHRSEAVLANPGTTNLTTLARDDDFATTPTSVYLICNEYGWKIGIGTAARAKVHGGTVALFTKPLPRLLAFELEQRVLAFYGEHRIHVRGLKSEGGTEYLSADCPVDVTLISELADTIEIADAFSDAWLDASVKLQRKEGS